MSLRRRAALALAAVLALTPALVAMQSASAANVAPFVGKTYSSQPWVEQQLGAMTVGVPYSDSISRGTATESWELRGTLPAGLVGTASGDQYLITGTPTAPGDVNFTIASFLGGEFDQIVFDVTVVGSPSTTLSLVVESPATFSPDDTIVQWQVNVRNTTGVAAQSPVVSFTPPAGFGVIELLVYGAWTCTGTTTYTCTSSEALAPNSLSYVLLLDATPPSSYSTSSVSVRVQASAANAPAVAGTYVSRVNLPLPVVVNPSASSYRSISLTGFAPNLATTGSIRFWSDSGVFLGEAPVQSDGSATFIGAIPASLSGSYVRVDAFYLTPGGATNGRSESSEAFYVYQQKNAAGSFYLNGALYTGAVKVYAYSDYSFDRSSGAFLSYPNLTGGSYNITPSMDVSHSYYMWAELTALGNLGTAFNYDCEFQVPTPADHPHLGTRNFTSDMDFCWSTAPTFTDSTLANPRKNVAYTDGVTATSNVDVSYLISSGALPTGLSLDADTGAITGTATVLGQPYTVQITASNGYLTSFVDLSGTVLDEHILPTWTDQTLGDFRINQTVVDGVAATGDPTIVYEVSNGNLPTGVTLDETTGQLSGAPSVLGEEYEFELLASNDWDDVSASFAGTVLPEVALPVWTDTMLGEMRVGETLADGVFATAEPAAIYFSLNLPSWIALNPATGAISATPAAAGPYDFTVTAANSVGTVDQRFTGTVDAAWIPPTFTDETIEQPQGGVYLDDQVLATGDGPIVYSVPLGELPEWLTLNAANGLLSGTPPLSAVGEPYSFTVTASAHGFSDTVTLTGVVGRAPELAIEPAFVVGDLAAGAEFDYGVSGAGDTVPFEVFVNSTPVSVASGMTSSLGSASGLGALPLNIESGAHSIVLTTYAADNTPRTVTLWFTVLANGRIGAISTTGPLSVTAAALASTGVDIGAPLGAALLLMLLGTAFVVRRRASTR